MRVLLLWAGDTSPNLGVRVLAAGHRALITSIWPQAEVVEHNFGAQASPVPMGSTRAEVKELLTGRGGVVDWLRDDFDLVVDTRSGDSFSDLYGLPRLTVMTLLAEAVRRSGTPLVYGPQTYGPYLARRARLMAKWSLRHADLVLARDSTSAEVVAGLGRPADLVTTDVVFALPQPSSPRRDGDVLFNVSGLLWRGAADVDPGEYRRIVVEAIRGLGESGRRVTLLAHVLAGKSGDSDVEVIDEVVRAVGSPLPVFVPDSLQDARTAMAGARLVIGSRMHACLNSLSVGVPAIPLAYSQKFAPLMLDIGWRHTIRLGSAADPVGQVLRLAGDAALGEQVPAVRAAADGKLAAASELIQGLVPRFYSSRSPTR
jgi:colanic acid/amylovoran biosynthesis protein